jgi:hypothetical protein
MEQSNDYVLRMTEVIGRAIAKIIGLKEKGQYTQALEEIFASYSEYFKSFNIVDEKNCQKLDFYYQFLQEEAKLYLELGKNSKAKETLDLALLCLDKLNKESKIYCLEREQGIKEIKLLISKTV